MKNEDRIVELLAELIVEVQGVRTEQKTTNEKVSQLDEKVGQLNEKVGQLNEKVGQLDEKTGRLESELVKLRQDMNRNHGKAMAGISEVRTSVVHLDEYITKLLGMEARINKLETTVYCKTG